MRLTIDFETRSACDIKKHGAWVYSEHPTTDIICCAIKVDGDAPVLWVPDWVRRILFPHPTQYESDFAFCDEAYLIKIFADADTIEAHNVFFERSVWENIATPRYGWPAYDTTKMRCSMAKCAYHALPRSLDAACKELALPVQKDEDGYKLMMKMCKPRRPNALDRSKFLERVRKAHGLFNSELTLPLGVNKLLCEETGDVEYLWHESPEQIIRLAQYCAQDVEAEHCLSSALADLPPAELAIWQLDQKINRRGVLVDVQTVEHIIAEIARYEEGLLNEVRRLTNQQVQGPKQIAASLAWLNERGAGMTCLDKQTVAEALGRDDLLPEVRRFLQIRQTLGKASTAKYEAIRKYAGRDGRVRGTLIHHGAATGRWSGAGPQVHNLPRGSFEDVEECVSAMKCGGFEHVELLWGDPMAAASTIIRPMFVAKDGHLLFVSDFASVEARVLAWLANEQKVLDAFRDNRDLYKVAAMDVYGKTYEAVEKSERQVGKTIILACGYQGGVGAFQSMAKNLGVNVPDEQAKEIVKAWREKNPAIVGFWRALEAAALQAVHTRNVPVEVDESGKILMMADEQFLRIQLPSGRRLHYYMPSLVMKTPSWGGDPKLVVQYRGLNSMTKKVENSHLYGGLLAENVTQAASRCLLAGALLRLEAAGYKIVLHVHDEAVAEVPDGFGSIKEFDAIMAAVPAWAKGLPLGAKGFVSRVYKK